MVIAPVASRSSAIDRPTQIGEWEPQNYSGGFRGAMTLRNAFAHSINTIAVQLSDGKVKAASGWRPFAWFSKG